jgi:hypothetical protein
LGGKIRVIVFSGEFYLLGKGEGAWRERIGIAFRAASGTLPLLASGDVYVLRESAEAYGANLDPENRAIASDNCHFWNDFFQISKG